jgi:hypothetical protein
MSKIDDLILKASNVGPKTKDEKDFRQVWFTRPEMKKVIELVLAEIKVMGTPIPSNDDPDDFIVESFCDFVHREFGVL